MRDSPWDPLAEPRSRGCLELASRKPSWPAIHCDRINRPDIWMQAIRSDPKNSCGTGAVHIWVPDRVRCAHLSGTTSVVYPSYDSIFKQPFSSWPGFAPAIHVFLRGCSQDVDARPCPGMTSQKLELQIRLRIPAARGARVLHETSPQKNRGRRECRALDAPADGVTGPRRAFQASRASYGAVCGARRAACLEGRRSSLTLMV